jgi:hypothetical protein
LTYLANSLSIASKYKEEDMSRFLALGVALVALLAFSATAQAQYDEPEGNLTPQGPTTTDFNRIINVQCVLRSASGQPIANELVYFEIVSGPAGTQLNGTSGITNNQGQVTVPLVVGNTPGTVRILCSDGDVEAFFVTQVLGAQIVPPTTGDAGLVSGSSRYAASAGLLLFAAASLLAARRIVTSR